METVLIVFACFCFMAFGAIIGNISNRHVAKTIISPLLSELRYAFRHVSAHDLQVYHGVNESDWLSTRPHEDPDRKGGEVYGTDLAAEAERLAQEFERLNGDLPPTAE
jgi:hypothetical protein